MIVDHRRIKRGRTRDQSDGQRFVNIEVVSAAFTGCIKWRWLTILSIKLSTIGSLAAAEPKAIKMVSRQGNGQHSVEHREIGLDVDRQHK